MKAPSHFNENTAQKQLQTINFLTMNIFAFSDFTLLVGQQEGHPACKKTE